MFYKLLLGPGVEKGFLLLGALFALQLKGHLVRINEFIGVSVGAIVAFYLVIGISFNELFEEALQFNLFDNWRDLDVFNWFFSKGSKGIVSASKIRDRLEFWMRRKYGRNLTFLELNQITGKKFIVTVTDRRDSEHPRPLYLSYENYPNYSVVDAVLESCTIPGVIEQKNPDFVDGAFSDPLPVQLLGKEPSIVFILRDNETVQDSNILTKPFEKILDTFLIPMKVLIDQKIQNISEKTMAIVLRRDSYNFIPRALSSKEKIDLIKSGFKQTINLV